MGVVGGGGGDVVPCRHVAIGTMPRPAPVPFTPPPAQVLHATNGIRRTATTFATGSTATGQVRLSMLLALLDGSVLLCQQK